MKNKLGLFSILAIVILIVIVILLLVLKPGCQEKEDNLNLVPAITYNLNLTVNGSGTTNPAIGTHAYDTGAVVTITATPASGWKFDGWTGSTSGTNGTVSIVMDSGKNITATFSEVTYALTMSMNGTGTTDPAVGTRTYDAGIVVNLTATPAPGWKFDNWTGSTSGTNATASLLMDGDKSITANFSKVTYTLTISSNGNGTTNPVAGTHSYDSDTVVNLTAVPAKDWKFIGWSGDNTATTMSTTITINSNKTVVATFKQSYAGSFGGKFSGREITGEYISGTFSVTINDKGDVRGTFKYDDGSYSGTIAGQVDPEGNLNATGTALVGDISIYVTWQGKINVSDGILSGEGTWSGAYGSGTFSGTGATSP
jgi:uncharacterized repeat protein (TIGR02543 family)